MTNLPTLLLDVLVGWYCDNMQEENMEDVSDTAGAVAQADLHDEK